MGRSITGKLATLGAVASLTAVSASGFASSASNSADDTVVPAFEQYLVELAFKSYDLKFTEVIGITQVGTRVYAKFDAVKVRGFRYPIDSIYKMTREEARNLVRGS